MKGVVFIRIYVAAHTTHVSGLRSEEVYAVKPEAVCSPDEVWRSDEVLVEHVSFVSIGRTRIHGWLFMPARPKYGALLYLPGYSAATYMDVLMGVYRQLATAGFVVFGIDPRGQGAVRPPISRRRRQVTDGISSP